jgi:hypothetical protein
VSETNCFFSLELHAERGIQASAFGSRNGVVKRVFDGVCVRVCVNVREREREREREGEV